MDLSHWDAVEFFSRDQIAYLLAGVEPNGGPYSAATEKRIKHYHKLISAAFNGALKHARKFADGITEPPDFIAPDIFEYDAWGDELPSLELRCSVSEFLMNPANRTILTPSDPDYSEKFDRDDIYCWTYLKGLTKGYSFNRVSNAQIPDLDQQPTPAESRYAELEFAFKSQLDALIQRYWNIADELNVDRDVDLLNRVGNWQRISTLDDIEDGKEFLTDSDTDLLSRVKASGEDEYLLDEEEAFQEWEWREASFTKKLIAFGVHVYCRIVAGKGSTEEAVFLFRLVSENLGLLERNGIEQCNFMAEHARAAANARHSKPGGSRHRQEQIRDIWASGKYDSRDKCAEQECAALDMSFATARKALRGTPDPRAAARTG